MIECTEKDGALHFAVRVAPNASRSQIVGEFDKRLRVRVAAPPVEGAANEELMRCPARAFKVPRRAPSWSLARDVGSVGEGRLIQAVASNSVL